MPILWDMRWETAMILARRMASSSQHPTRKREPRQSKDQAGNNVPQNSVENVDSQMSFHQNYFGADGPSCGHFSNDPASYNDQPGATFDTQTTYHKYGAGPMPDFMQQSTGDVIHPKHIDTMHKGSQPSNGISQSSNIGSVSLEESGLKFRQNETSTAYRENFGSRHEAQAESSRQMEFAAPSQKRGEAQLEEGMVETRPSKRQCQPKGRLESQTHPEREQQLQPQSQDNELDL